ncbi:DUF3515 domain-containing protein [Streptomyces sp. HUAS TT20]|uniref:DUF3515 domain-containing protein n=1 Tax=Streptomyces sp. HUAS TT20 TaxID=3447509 RepID=UPI0021D8C6F8|nr:DUF3515 domain-containing protein [Streptomyces sp. HUAS 15-9]UXY30830.1 DUF3515 domain-containing protein [Streptomyces sp. HUAS 15-9]
MTRTRTAVLLTALAAIAAALTVAVNEQADRLDPAPRAHTAACRALARTYPDRIGDLKRTATAPGAASYGHGNITLRCGLPPLLPTEETCVTTEGVDWVIKKGFGANQEKTIVTYGRTPAAEAVISADTPTDVALVEIAHAVKALPANGRKCISASDVPSPGAVPEESIPAHGP